MPSVRLTWQRPSKGPGSQLKHDHRLHKAVTKGLYLAVLLALVGCQSAADSKKAEARIEEYFKTLRRENWQTVLQMYSPSFYAAQNRDEWRQKLSDLLSRVGRPLRARLVQSYAAHVTSVQVSRSDVQLDYAVEYERGRTRELFRVICPVNGAQCDIARHKIDVDASQK